MPFGARELAETGDDVGPQSHARTPSDRFYCETCGRVAIRLADLRELPTELITSRKPVICGLCAACARFHD